MNGSCSKASLTRPCLSPPKEEPMMALGTLTLGVVLFTLFFALVAACDRI
jgi:hypothetical protein